MTDEPADLFDLEHIVDLTITVRGKAQTAGSKRGFVVKGKNGGRARAIVVDDNPNSKPWKGRIADAGAAAMIADARTLFTGPLEVWFTFTMERPRGHFNAAGQLNAAGRGRPYPTVKPDALKLARAAEDALTGIVWTDDKIIVTEHLAKRYGSTPGVRIDVRRMHADL